MNANFYEQSISIRPIYVSFLTSLKIGSALQKWGEGGGETKSNVSQPQKAMHSGSRENAGG